jgi:Homeodomain
VRKTEEITNPLQQIKSVLSSQAQDEGGESGQHVTGNDAKVLDPADLFTDQPTRRSPFDARTKLHLDRASQDLATKLKKRGHATSSELNSIFRKHARDALNKMTTQHRSMQRALEPIDDKDGTSLNLLRDSLSAMFSQWLKQQVAAIVKQVEQQLDKIRGERHRGRYLHDPKSVAILDFAFSRCAVPSRAERKVLEELTGLEPRQVLVYFQNKRHRQSFSSSTEDSKVSSPMPTNGYESHNGAQYLPQHQEHAHIHSSIVAHPTNAHNGYLALSAPASWRTGLVPEHVPTTYEFTFNMEALGLPTIPSTWHFHSANQSN